MKLSTERLILRPLNTNDKQAIFEYHSNAECNKYQGWIPKTLSDVEQFIGKLAPIPNQVDTWFQLAIIEKESEKLIGDVGIHFIGNENKQVGLGYTLAQKYQGLGFANEAITRTIDYLFLDLKKHRITASVDPNNISSIRLLEKLGFRKEAHFIESYNQDGKWMDDALFALLSREWTGD